MAKELRSYSYSNKWLWVHKQLHSSDNSYQSLALWQAKKNIMAMLFEHNRETIKQNENNLESKRITLRLWRVSRSWVDSICHGKTRRVMESVELYHNGNARYRTNLYRLSLLAHVSAHFLTLISNISVFRNLKMLFYYPALKK